MGVNPRGADLQRFLDQGPEGEVVMINLLRFAKGGREQYEAYAYAIEPFLLKVGGELTYAGIAGDALVAEDGQAWDAIVIVKYPRRDAFRQMVMDPGYQAITHLRTSPLRVHAQPARPIDAAAAELATADPHRYATYLASRPPAAEEQAIQLVTRLCRATRARTHIVHHSAATALPLLRAARAEGLPLTAETCPHYLHFTAEAIPDGATPFKCAPPIRDAANREALWAALAEGVLDLVARDHSPCSPALKALEQGDFMAAWGGVAGLQLAQSIVWTEAARRGHTLSELVRWMCEGPARLAGVTGKKVRIAEGADADLVIFADAETQTVNASGVHRKHKVTPYLGETVRGVVHATYLRGTRVAEGGKALALDRGELL